jgi:predicted nucleic acid-binding protein
MTKMAGSNLDAVAPGVRLFIDSSVMLYVFSGASSECRRLLERCEDRSVSGVTSVLVLVDVCHRLMAMEAVSKGLIRPAGAGRALRNHPEIVRRLTVYREHLERIPVWGIDVLPLDTGLLMRAADVRAASGLLTNDSVIVATMADAGVNVIATADRDFERVEGLQVFRPTDLGSAGPALA